MLNKQVKELMTKDGINDAIKSFETTIQVLMTIVKGYEETGMKADSHEITSVKATITIVHSLLAQAYKFHSKKGIN